jgi:hypothetical protein
VIGPGSGNVLRPTGLRLSKYLLEDDLRNRFCGLIEDQLDWNGQWAGIALG